MGINSESLIGQLFLDYVIMWVQKLKDKAKIAFKQIKNDEDLFFLLDEKSNSIAILIRHLAGNMKSQWTDFLTTDGEKPDRNRPSEFDRTIKLTKNELMETREEGWRCVFAAISSLSPTDLMKEIYIRKKKYSVSESIGCKLSHYSTHIGQIIFLAKHIELESWEWVDIY
jgi:hypothetical protein